MKKPAGYDRIDLHGHTVDEAIIKVEAFLYQAYQARLNRVFIIHGKGTGVLKTEIARFLSTHRLVRSFYTADKFNGGQGATQANLVC